MSRQNAVSIDFLRAVRAAGAVQLCVSLLLTAGIAVSCNAAQATMTKKTAPSRGWAELQKAGTDALDANQYWIAEPTLQQALIKAGEYGTGDMRMAKSLGELGRLYSIRGRFLDAEPYFEEELHVEREALGPNSTEIVPAMGSLIQFYLRHGTASKADPLTEEMLAYIDGKVQEPSFQTHGKLKFKKGMALEGWAAETDEASRDPVIEWAITCDAVGNEYRAKENYDLAERLYKTALTVKETVLGKKHLSLANSYDSLGTLCVERKDYAQAESYYKDALAMTERILQPGNPQIYARLDKLARCLIKDGKPKEAEDLYVRAQDFWKGEDSANNDQARDLYALGSLYCDEKNYEAAAPVLEKALAVAEDVDGPNSITLVPFLQRYAYALYYLHRKPEMQELRARADVISGTVQ